jgi:O-antigen/teichoic acid export membrane protein
MELSLVSQVIQIFTTGKEKITAQSHNIKPIGALAGGNIAGSILSAVGGILVVRFVAPEINGQFRLFTIPLMYLTFLHLGTFDGLYRQIPFHAGRNQLEYVEKLAAAAGAWNIGIAIVVGSGFMLCSLWSLWQGNYINAAGWLSQVAACGSIFYVCYLITTYRTLNNFIVFARIQFIQAVVGFCLVLAVFFWGFYGLCLRSAVPSIIAVWLFHQARPLRMRLHFNGAAFKEVIKIGMPLCFWGTLYTALWTAAEYSLMLHFGGVKGLGLFSVAVIMRESLVLLPNSVNQVFMPRVVESFARHGGVAYAARRTLLVAGLTSLFMVVAVLIISVLLNYFVPVFIPKYMEGLPLMKVCLWQTLIEALSLPLNGLVATGRSWLYGKGVLVGLLVFPLAVAFLNPLVGGMMAVVLGSLGGRLVRTVVAYYDFILLMRQELKWSKT